MDPILIIVGMTVVVGAALWYNRPLPPKKSKKQYTVEVGVGKKEGEGVPRRNVLSPNLLKIHPTGVKTIYDVFEHAVKNYPKRNCVGIRKVVKVFKEEKIIDGAKKTFTFPQLSGYEWETYEQVHAKVKNLASGLVSLGMKEGDFLAMYEDTRPEWTMTSRAAYAHKLVCFTVYANLGQDALIYALNQGEIKYIFTNGALLKQINNIHEKVPSIKTIIYNDTPNADAKAKLESAGVKVISFDEVLDLGKANPVPDNPPAPEDLAIIMYTSGSTGVPKGVMISHKNMVAAVSGLSDVIDFNGDDVILHYLPLAHSMAFVIENVSMYHGLPFGYGSPRTLSDTGVRQCKGDLRELSPTILVAVPTIYEKIRQGIMVKINQSGLITKMLFSLAYFQKKNAYYAGLDTPFWNRIIFNKFKDRVGGRIRIMVTGSAPLSPEVHDFIRVCFGCPLLQGYGLTETCSCGTAQQLDDKRVSCAGTPLTTTEIMLRDIPDMGYLTTNKPRSQGEVLIKSASITLGYYKNEAKTKEAFLDGGWFATGDIGQWNDNGTLSIIDRKKNLIKPPHGEYIALEKLESAYRNSNYVELVCCYADSTHYHPVALVQPSKQFIEDYAKSNGISTADWDKVITNKKILAFLVKELQQTGRRLQLRSIEMIKGVYIVPVEFTPDNHLLTAAMKLNRNEVYKQYRGQIDAMYAAIKK